MFLDGVDVPQYHIPRSATRALHAKAVLLDLHRMYLCRSYSLLGPDLSLETQTGGGSIRNSAARHYISEQTKLTPNPHSSPATSSP